MPTLLAFNQEVRDALRTGFDMTARVLRATLGPSGRTVIVGGPGAPLVSRSSVELARQIRLADPLQNIGAALARDVAIQATERFGGGGTTAVVLAQQMLHHGLRSVAAGVNPVAIRRGIEAATADVCAELERRSTPVSTPDEVRRLATVAANDAGVGSLIAEAFAALGPEGVLSVEESAEAGVAVEILAGMSFDRGYLAPEMVTDTERGECVLTDAWVLAYDGVISTNAQLLPMLDAVLQSNAPLFIAAVNIEGDALATLVMNMKRQMFTVGAIKASWFIGRRKGMLLDLATFTGGHVLGDEGGIRLETAGLSALGRARRVTLTRASALVVGGHGADDGRARRVQQLRLEIDAAGSPWERERLRERVANLTSGVAVLRVGATTTVERAERRRRVEDAVAAMSAAVKQGVVPGGGSSLAHVAEVLDGPCAASPDELLGRAAVRASLGAPLTWISRNAGHDGPAVTARVVRQGWGVGIDVESGQLVDLVATGVVDPVSIVCGALQTAASTVALALTSEVLVAERPEAGLPPDDLGWHGRDSVVTGAGSPRNPPQRLSTEQLKRLSRRVPR